MLGGFLELTHPLEVTDGRRHVFDADAQKGRHRDTKQLRELLKCLNFGKLAFLEAVEGRPGDADAFRDFVRAQPGAEPKCTQPVCDLFVTDGQFSTCRSAAFPCAFYDASRGSEATSCKDTLKLLRTSPSIYANPVPILE
ncbi:MAG: hypothetical protein WBB98_00400 [Xanthobacteraceae bacterium]